MLFAISMILAILSLIQAQDVSNLPPCSFTCLLNGVGTSICGSTDYSCICRALPAFQDSLMVCLSGACDATDLAATSTVLGGICSQAGVAISLPTASVSGSATGTGSTNPSRTPPLVLANPTTTMATMTTPIAQATTATFAPSSTSSVSQSTGLSGAAKVGLGLGIPLAVAFLGGFAWLFYRLHQQKVLHLQRMAAGPPEATSGPTRRLTEDSETSVDVARLQDAVAFSGYHVDLEGSKEHIGMATIELPANPATRR